MPAIKIPKSSGLLLHLSSLPSPFGIGDLGEQAFQFVDFLKSAGQKYWQILPLNPTEGFSGHSPYSSLSAMAFNSLLISPGELQKKGYLTAADLAAPYFSDDFCDFEKVVAFKRELFLKAFRCFKDQGIGQKEYQAFCLTEEDWLNDYALFVAIKESYGGQGWFDWPEDLRDRNPDALKGAAAKLSERIDREQFLQFIFMQQWQALKAYAKKQGICFIGDIPIYVNYDSVDVWRQRDIFKLDSDGRRLAVAGVPPDYFSQSGQLWGNPVYRWERLQETGYGWWLKRLGHNLRVFDLIRVDHFRGLVSYWEVPPQEPTAINGQWVPVPHDDFFQVLKKTFNPFPIIAEDLGIITDDVRALMQRFDIPGMKVLLFAFGEDLEKHPYLPHNYSSPCLVYTGTHDNNTARGWFEHEAGEKEKSQLAQYAHMEISSENVHRVLIQLALASPATIAIFPMQDVLGLGKEARMNTPGTGQGNWRWRLKKDFLTVKVAQELKALTRRYRK